MYIRGLCPGEEVIKGPISRTPVHPSKQTVGQRASQVHDARDVAQGSEFGALQKSLCVGAVDLRTDGCKQPFIHTQLGA